jgi:hypothetical protein
VIAPFLPVNAPNPQPPVNRLPYSSIQLSPSCIPILISIHRFGLPSSSFGFLVLFDDDQGSFLCSDSAVLHRRTIFCCLLHRNF